MIERPEPDGAAEIFAAYHRSEFVHRAFGAGVGIVGAIGSVLVVVLLGAAAPSTPSTPQPTPPAVAEPSSRPTGTPETLPAPVENVVPDVASVAVAPAGWSIAIGATGYQAELDRCQWVRMDLGAVAPIIGAHTSCGGAIVLEMTTGESVTLTGEGLDGDYVVTDSRDAQVGDIAATATAGMTADVILQTCYRGADNRVRLIAVRRAAPAFDS